MKVRRSTQMPGLNMVKMMMLLMMRVVLAMMMMTAMSRDAKSTEEIKNLLQESGVLQKTLYIILH